MTLDQSALLEVLDALKVADVGDRVRQAAETMYQASIEAELTEGSAPPRLCAARIGWRSVMVTGRGSCRRRRGIWSCGSRSFVPVRSFRVSWNGAGG